MSCFASCKVSADRFDQDREFLPWALTIAKHEVFAATRDRQRMPRSLSPEVIDLICSDATTIDFDEDRTDALAECLDQLPPRSRQAIEMRYALALRPAEISRRLSLQVETVYVTLSKARSLLKDCVTRRLGQDRLGREGAGT